MTPQERQLVEELFDRLGQVENLPRDPEAERLIAQGVGSAPHAVYALTQTALIQDEALKRANVRIEELQAELDGTTASDTQRGSFLDSMRDAVLGPRASARSSVPSVRADAPQTGYGPQSQPPDIIRHRFRPALAAVRLSVAAARFSAVRRPPPPA